MRQLRVLGWLAFAPLAVLGLAGPAHAYANTPPIDPSYNSRIIDDGLFLNTNTMSVADIQNFLNAKVPTCDTNHQGGDPNQPPPYVCLRNYVDPVSGHSAAQLIHDTAVAMGINPEVILVTLEKEEGLVTDTWPYPSQYKSAMGYGCPESQSVCDSQYYGFNNQVTLGSKLLRVGTARDCGDTSTFSGWTAGPQWKLGNTTAVDGKPTYMGTCATGSLYNYTPHRPDSAYTLAGDGHYYYGNYNFIKYFTSWFGPTTVLLAKTAGAPQIYLTYGDANGAQKLLVPNSEVMTAWNLQGKPVSIVDQAYLDGFTDAGTLSTLAKKDNGSDTIYLMDQGRQYAVPSGQVCTDWALSCFDTSVVKSVPPYLIESLAWAGNMLPMFSNQGIVYKPLAGKKRPVMDWPTLKALGGWAQVMTVQNTNASQPIGTLLLSNDTMVKFGGGTAIYLYDQDELHAFPGPDVLAAWGNGGEPVQTAPAGSDAGLTSGGAMAPLATDSGGGKWLLDNGRRNSLAGHEADWPVGSAVTFGNGALQRLPASTVAPILRAPNGDIYTAGGGKRYVFPTMDDFFGLGNSVSSIGNASSLTESLLTYGGMHLAPGRVFKVAGSDTLYMNNGATSLTIPSLAYFGYYDLPYNKTITVDTTTAARYPASPMQILFKDGVGNVFVAGGGRQTLSAGVASAGGVDTSSLPTVTGAAIARMGNGPAVTQFVKGSDGAIYYLNGGQRHYVSTPAKLAALGGSSSVVSVPDEFVSLITNGPAA